MKTRSASVIPTALVVMFLWGSLFPMIKKGYAAFGVNTSFVPDILTFAGLRFTVCGALITAFALLTRRRMKLTKTEWFPVLIVGLFSIILHYTCPYIGLTTTDSGKTALLKQLAAALFIPLSFLFIKEEKFSYRKILSSLLCLGGITVLNIGSLGFSMGTGEILIIAASFCSVAGGIFSKKVVRTVDPIVLTGYSQLLGGLVLLSVGLSGGGGVHPVGWSVLPVFGYICFACILSFCLWNSVIRKGELSFL